MMTLRRTLLAVFLLAGVAWAGPAEDVQVLWNQGAEHFQQGRSEQAVEVLERALDLSRRALGEDRPETAASWEFLGLVLLDRREVARARDCLERSVRICRQALGPGHLQTGRALVGLARAREASGDDPGADEAYAEAERILRATPGGQGRLGEALLRHGKQALRLGRWASAVALLQESREVLAGSPQARAVDLPLATALVRAGRHAEAERACREALAADPGEASFLVLRGEALFYLGRYAEARRDYEAASATEPLRARALAGLSRVSLLEGDAETARRRAEEALELRLRTLGPTHLEVANSYNDLCAIATQQLDFERALDLCERSLAIAEGQPVALQLLHNRARLLAALGRPEARAALEDVVRRARAVASQDPRLLANCLNTLGILEVNQERFREALPPFEESLRLLESVGGEEQPWVVLLLSNLGTCRVEAGDREGARRELERAHRLAARSAPLDRVTPALALGNLHLEQGEALQALPFLREALEALRGVPGADGKLPVLVLSLQGADLLGQAAFATWRQGRDPPALEEADGAFAAAMEVFEHLRRGASSEATRERMVRRKFEVCPRAAVAAAERGDADRALAYAEQGLARGLLEILSGGRSADLGGVPAERREALQDLEGRLEQAEGQLQPGAMAGGVEAARRYRDLLAEHAAAVERLRADYPRYAELQYPQAASAAEIRASLRPDEAALLYLLGKERSLGFLVTRDAVATFPLPPRQEVEDLADRLRVLVARGGVPDEARQELGRLLLGSLAGRDLAGRRLVLVPTGRLLELPFEVLPPLPGEEGRFLVEGHELVYTPSLSFLRLLRTWDRARPRPPDRALLLGDPDYGEASAPDARYRAADPTLAFPPLPGTREEVRGIARLLGEERCDVRLGPEASEGAFRGEPADRYRFLHFAAHGVLGRGAGLSPALVLAQVGNPAGVDGFLTMEEVLGIPLAADLVVLSACQTARGRLDPGEGVVGLSRAFLLSGASSVVATLWDVEDRSTAEFMAEFYGAVEEGLTPSAALRRARLRLLAEGQDPSRWAPFVLVGLPGDR